MNSLRVLIVPFFNYIKASGGGRPWYWVARRLNPLVHGNLTFDACRFPFSCLPVTIPHLFYHFIAYFSRSACIAVR